jgi:hypothetical protein
MSNNKHIRLIGKRAAFNAEVWARAVEALARQLVRETAARTPDGDSKPPEIEAESGS